MKDNIAFELEDNENMWVNQKTGEVRYINVNEKRKTDETFIKVYKVEYERVSKTFVGKEALIFAFIIRRFSEKDNKLRMTYERISKGVGVSIRTVASAMAKFQKVDCLRYVQNGLWMVNPCVATYGYPAKKRKLYAEYKSYGKFYEKTC